MEPGYLDRLPPRFRKRYRENLIVFGVLIALFVIPQHVGPYGYTTFFTILWLANSAFYLSRLRSAEPRPGAPAFVLFGLMSLLFGYPLAIAWTFRQFDMSGLVAIGLGVVALWSLMIAYRRVILPSLFGKDRQNIASEFRTVRAAQIAHHADFKKDLDDLKNELRPSTRSDG